MPPRFWLLEWLDQFHVSNIDRARLLLVNPSVVEELRARAGAANAQSEPSSDGGESVLAGRGIDLSGRLDCSHPECRKLQVENLFSKVWHYFDRIIVEDAVSHEVSVHWDDGPERVREYVLSHIEVLLYVKEFGAEDLLEFRPKPTACVEHFRHHAEQAGLAHVADAVDEIVASLEEGTRWTIERSSDGSVLVELNNSLFEHTQWRRYDADPISGMSDHEIMKLALTSVVRTFVAHLVADTSAAKHYKSPLGAVVGVHRKILDRFNKVGAEDVAFRLELPVLRGAPAKTLIAIRKEEHEYFARFQAGLKKAIEERLKTVASANADAIAWEIQRDLVDSNVERIRERLRCSERVLGKKTAVGLMLGGLATTCGLLCGVPAPLAISGGMAAVVSATGSAAGKHLDERAEIELEDMYFAWKASEHVPHNH